MQVGKPHMQQKLEEDQGKKGNLTYLNMKKLIDPN